MNILAHRGIWKKDLEKNSLKSLILSFKNDFGIETDLRDFHGSLVISHDPVLDEKNLLYFRDFLKEYKKYNFKNIMALNIKSDGIILKAEKLLREFEIENYFYFDMSIPQLINAYNSNVKKIFCRESEYESTEKVLNLTSGVWIDSFNGSHENLKNLFTYFLKEKKRIAIVSPELHGKDLNLMYNCWENIKSIRLDKEYDQNIMLCTDHPLKAKSFF